MQVQAWAEACFGRADLGDARRTRRLVAMAVDAVRRPEGRVSAVFTRAAQRQGAYDFLENDAIAPSDVGDALFDATARSARGQDRIYVAVDGCSLKLTDREKTKGFGYIGAISKGARGLKVMNALALQEDGVPLGLIDQMWWVRRHRTTSHVYRPAHQRETVHWRTVVSSVSLRLKNWAPKTKAHFLFDREGDAALLLRTVAASGHEFTCRANPNRRVLVDVQPCDVRRILRKPPVTTTFVVLPARPGRRARVAQLDIWSAKHVVVMRDHHEKQRKSLPLTVVWARERGRPASRGGLNWFLYTNVDVASADDVLAVVSRYTLRWRVEEFHRAWKGGVCRVEESQLRSPAAVIKWATILAAVATRAERLRLRARTAGQELASTEFSDDELLALATLRSESHPREEVRTDHLVLADAVRWIAELGGYIASKKNGPPGTVTIARGLEPLTVAAILIAKLRASGQLR
jgi:hypothetical protein